MIFSLFFSFAPQKEVAESMCIEISGTSYVNCAGQLLVSL